ncbi:MAG TPA: hypothetical protein V6C71_26020 [Coleofasciculaceae cyanobacterium]
MQSISLKHHSTIPPELGARGQNAIAFSIHQPKTPFNYSPQNWGASPKGFPKGYTFG